MCVCLKDLKKERVCVYMLECVCVCERERERESERVCVVPKKRRIAEVTKREIPISQNEDMFRERSKKSDGKKSFVVELTFQ